MAALQAADKRLLNRMEHTLYWLDIAKVPGPKPRIAERR